MRTRCVSYLYTTAFCGGAIAKDTELDTLESRERDTFDDGGTQDREQ